MRLVFADTVYWVALINPRDALFDAVTKVAARFGPYRIVTSELVLVELLNGVSWKGASLRRAASRIAQEILDDPMTDLVPHSSAFFRQALALYCERPR
jgi:hypothetical protein